MVGANSLERPMSMLKNRSTLRTAFEIRVRRTCLPADDSATRSPNRIVGSSNDRYAIRELVMLD